MRKFPPVAFVNRVCTKNYKIPDEDTVIEKGTLVAYQFWESIATQTIFQTRKSMTRDDSAKRIKRKCIVMRTFLLEKDLEVV